VRLPGFEPGSQVWEAFTVDYSRVKNQFFGWMRNEEYSDIFVKDVKGYLERYVSAELLKNPLDVLRIFESVQRGKRHLALALRTLFNFYEVLGFEKAFLDRLRKALPNIECGIDLRIPTENDIVASLKHLTKAPVKYQALFSLLLDSGLRLVEGVELINNFKEAENVNGFYRCVIAMFRGEKQAYYGHFSEYTLGLIKEVKEKPDRINGSHYFKKYGFVAPKYLRKFAFDKMIELEIPESIADFIEGRVPKRIGAKHYMALARQSSKFYPRYMEYITQLRQKTLN